MRTYVKKKQVHASGMIKNKNFQNKKSNSFDMTYQTTKIQLIFINFKK